MSVPMLDNCVDSFQQNLSSHSISFHIFEGGGPSAILIYMGPSVFSFPPKLGNPSRSPEHLKTGTSDPLRIRCTQRLFCAMQRLVPFRF